MAINNMRRGITYDEVAAVAKIILENNEVPTIERVRAALGGTGSYTTLSKYLNEWKHSVGLTAGVDPIQTAVQRVWQQLREETDAEIVAIKMDCQAQVDRLKLEQQETSARAEASQEEYQQFEKRFNDLYAAKELQSIELRKFMDDNQRLDVRYQELEKRYADFQRMTVQHQTDISEAHKREISLVHEKAQLRDDENQQRLLALQAQRQSEQERFQAEIHTLKINIQQLNDKVHQYQTNIQTKEVEITKLRGECSALKNERDHARTELSSEKKYRDIFGSNLELNQSILSEVKSLSSTGIGFPWVSCALDASNQMGLASEKMENLFNETKNLFHDYSEETKNLFNNYGHFLEKPKTNK